MELWDIYDADRNRTGRTIQRGEPFADGEYQLVVHVCIFNLKGEMLIQQRQSTKCEWPDMWNITSGGGVLAGENSQEAAMRETWEELGIHIDLNGVRPRYTIHFEHGFDDIYVVNCNLDMKDIHMQSEEVQNVCWASKEKVLKMIRDKEFIPFYPSFIEYLFESRKDYGFLEE